MRSSLGSANKIKYLLQNRQLVSNNCPINVYGQAWTLMMTMPYARCAGDCRRICTGERCANKYPTLARAEIQTHHIFGVFLGRKASFLVTRGGCESFRKGKSQLPQNILQRGRLMGPTAGPRIPA